MISMPAKTTAFLFIILCCLGVSSRAQETSVNWLTFEQLEDSLNVQPKPVFIDFYTKWCTYCRKMDKVVFTKPDVIHLLNATYYAVRFDAESASEVVFGGQTFINDQLDQRRSPIHQIAQLLATRQGQFTPPAMILLDEDFSVTARCFEYMDSKRFMRALSP